MPKKSFRHYVTNIINFANSRTKNKFRDRSFEYFAGRVTPEFSQLMVDVWLPIIGEDKEIKVFRVVRPKNVRCLGISIEGFMVEQQDPQPSTSTSYLQEQEEHRHFVQHIIANSLFGSLNCLQPGDEILQVNGYRLHGQSHLEAVRCLRCLPSHIEIVIARSSDGIAGSIGDADCEEGTLRIAASEIGSMRTGYDYDCMLDYRSRSGSLDTRLAGTQPTNLKVTEWVRQSRLGVETDMSIDPREIDDGNSTSLSLCPSPSTSVGFSSFPQDKMSSLRLRNYPFPSVPDLNSSLTSSSRNQKPTWGSVPLILMLRRDNPGFGFSFSEFEVLDVSESSPSKRRTSTLGRRRTISSDISTYPSGSSTLPRFSSSRRGTLSRSSNPSIPPRRGVLLIDRITPGGCVEKDGRLAVGDRLLFVNDRKLSRASVQEAAVVLQTVPIGYTMIGVAKMKLVNSELPRATLSSPQMTPLEDEKEYKTSTSPVFTTSMQDEYANDHPLDYYSRLVTSVENAHLHAHDISSSTPVQEMDRNEETVIRVKTESLPLGLKLDASALAGVDGCRVIQVVRGGAIERSASLMPGDYITRINSESLRNVSNTEAFRILRKISLDCPNIEIAYYPADKIASHRAKFINAPEKLNDQPMESSISLANGETVVGSVEDAYHLLTTTSLELSSEVLQSGPWMQTREVKLLKLPGEQTWGFRITGPECWESEEKDLPLPPEVALPVFISEVIPNTAAERGQLLQPGDIIVGMNGMDASSVGCRRVAEWMQHSIVMSATSPKCANSDVDSDNPVNNECSFLYLLILPLNPAEEEPFEASHYDPLIRGGNRHSVDLQTIPSVKLSSPDTSIETKILNHDSGPTSFMGTNDNLIRSEFVSSNDSSMLEEEPSSVATLDHAYDLSIPQPLAFTGLTINPPDASHSASETEPETVSVDRPPSSAATRSRVAVAKSSVSSPLASSQVHVIPNIQSVESQSAWRNIGSQLSASLPSLTKSYRRIDVPRDEVHVAAMLIKGADASSTPQNSHQSVGECETLGIRLVGHRDTNKRGVFICSIRNDSIADRTPGLHVTDEILQINNICVLGLTHVSAKLMISKETEMVRRVLIGSQVTSNGNHQRFGKLYIVIRHNVAYNASVMAKPANLDSAQFLPRGVNSTSVVDIMDMSPSPLMSSSPTNGPLHGISRSPSQRPTTKNVDIVNVLIERNKSGFGLCLVNMNPKRELGVFVQNIDPSSPAGRSNLIKCWDRIIAVNGQEIDDYDSTLQILTHCKLRADLRLVRVKEGHSLDAINEVDSSVPQSFSPQKFPTPLARGVETVLELIKGQGDLGISIVGGSDSSLGGVFVQEIFEKGFASKDGRLESGDRLLAVNEFDLRNATHAAATQALRSTGQRVLLTVIRDIPSKHSSARFQQIFSIPLQRKPGQQFGLILDDCKTASGVIIANIVTGSAASRNTVLQPGDFILEVDGLDVRKASSDEVSDLLKQCSNYVLLKAGRPSSSQPPPQLRLFTTLLTRDRQSSTPCLSSVSIAKISHSPVANIFGMVLREATEMELLCAPGHLIIDAILPDSGAARCGMLQVGDRVLSLDREPVDWLTFEELEAFTRHFDSLLFEFGRLPPPASALAALNSSKRIFRDQTFGIMTSTPCESGLGTLKEDVMVMPECPQPVQQDVEQPPTHFQTNCIDGMLTKQPQAIDEEQEDLGAQIQVLRISLPFVKPPPSGISDWLHCDPTKIPIPQLGLRIVAAPGSCGQRVVGIQPGSPGQISGLLLDDQILGLDDHLLVAFGGQNSEKTLLAIKEAWLLRVQDGEFISPVSLTVIRSASKPNKQTSFEPRRSIDNGFVSHLPSQHNSTNLSAIGFTPIVASQFPVRLANHQRKYPKDVGDNIDVNLQAAPPGLLAGLGAGAILGASAAGAWRGAIDDYSGQPFHLPGEREIVAPPNVDGYTMLGQEPEDSNDHDPNLSNDENHEYYEQNSSDPMGIENIPPPALCDDYQQQQQQHDFATEATVDYQENQINYNESEQQQQVEDQ